MDCCSLSSPSLYNFFIAIDDDRGSATLKNCGRKTEIITGLVILIIASLVLASSYGAFSGIYILNNLSIATSVGGYVMVGIGGCCFVGGVIREVAAQRRSAELIGNFENQTVISPESTYYS